jgi:bifunctional non-homologous end joining protein LigD
VALLSTYRKKRRFGVTAEPRGKQGRTRGDAFVIQKHAATRLHYDLRLELDGVMKSWAVTRGPSLVPGEKRLAVQVEDHPVEYNTFEGTIPKGQYGGGTVLIWDRGRWTPEHDPHKGLAKGHLDFTLDGEKLHGRWHLMRMHRRRGEKRDNWLLIKSDDEFARGPRDPDILEEKARSVVSKRTLEQIAKAEGAVWQSNRSVKDNVKAIKKTKATKSTKKSAKAPPKANAKKTKTRSKSRATLAAAEVLREAPKRAGSKRVPDFVPPQLATLHDRPPDGAGWVHEVKFDGYRMQARLDGGKVALLTRKALDWTAKFKPVANAAAELDAQSALIDGEIVVEGVDGVSNFSALQDALKTGKSNFVYYVFDLLHLDGADLTGKPLVERKAALQKLLKGSDRNGVVRLSEHFEISGADMYRHACAHNLEGLISKRRDAPYRSGRSESWIKTKCHQAQEFAVAGYKDSTHLKGAIGALVLGYYEDGKLRYAGRSGTGYSVATAQDLWQRLQPLRVDKPAFGRLPDEERGRKGIWVEPKLVVEVTFAGWTAQKHVRHAVFKGVREDKPGREIVRETPMPTKSTKKAKAAKPVTTPKAKSKSAGDAPVKFTHPDRIYWTDVEITKQQLAEYYTSVWDLMAPHVVNRPLALVRCPEGVGGQCFFQKHAAAGLVSERIRRIKDEKGEELIYIDDLDGLRTLVQAGVLEIHVWGSTVQDIEHCSRIVFDLDPGDDVPWAAVNKAARELRERLDAIKLKSFVKTTGGKGLHVVVPVQGAGWDEAKDFAHALTLAMAADSPDKYVSKMTKSIRGGKIFIDYLRNGRGATAIVAYSTRARAGAPLSVPVTWDELGPNLKPNKFTLLNIKKRLGALKRDPWADIGKVKQKLPKLG